MPRPLRADLVHDRAVDVLQVHVGDELAVGVEERHRVAAAEGGVAAVEAEAEHARVDLRWRTGRSRAASRRRCPPW